MPSCPGCAAALPPDALQCSSCGQPTPRAGEVERLAEAVTGAPTGHSSATAVAPAASATTPRSSWLSSSGSIDHGRFPPGTVLADRYRILARLGKGGMGEVYRADDMRLGQPVALKFLPDALERDPVKLSQFHNEVRLARQISHPSVCRVYDIGETDGVAFLSMEFVDGEDLASLLRRIGRLPQDKGVDIARQLCAGLAAAHARGVLHRDLKPSNVMLDGEGKVRLTDFGLATVAGVVDASRAGTPAYMSPEQLGGRELTIRSDVFALGLVLYEVFTGRRAFESTSLHELMRKHETGDVEPPSAVVPALDPGIDRAILRCLEFQPAARPASALAVAAALPGGDPLAAALAAGETPSPEMVAAAGEKDAYAVRTVALATAATLAALSLAAVLIDRNLAINRGRAPKAPAVLVDRSQDVIRAAGYAVPVAHDSWGHFTDDAYRRFLKAQPELTRQLNPAAGPRSGLLFFYRTSPRQLEPLGATSPVTTYNPPLSVTGMTVVVLDGQGRLNTFHAVPSQVDGAAGGPGPVDWSKLFAAAGLPSDAFSPVTPLWTPRVFADARTAWEGLLPEYAGVKVRIEAASYRGRPVYFQLIGPWTEPTGEQEVASPREERLANTFTAIAVITLLGCAGFVARMNLRAGRGDARTALRMAGFITVLQLLAWALRGPHMADASSEVDRFFGQVGEALFTGGLIWLLYVAVEPWVRRFWPDSLMGWSRLASGRLRDPRIGRDVLTGVALGATWQWLLAVREPLQETLGYVMPPLIYPNVEMLGGTRFALASYANFTFAAPFNVFWITFAIAGLKVLLRRNWLVNVVAVVFLTLLTSQGMLRFAVGNVWVNWLVTVSVIALITFAVVRFGVLALFAAFSVSLVLSATPLTLDSSRHYFPQSTLGVLLLFSLVAFGAWAMRGGTSLVGTRAPR